MISIFEKVQIKIVNAVICGKKIKCERATGNKLVFYFGLILDKSATIITLDQFTCITGIYKSNEAFVEYIKTGSTQLNSA